MVFRPNEFRNKDGVGMPADDLATDTTSAWTSVALLKGIFAKLGGGTSNVFPTNVAQNSTTSGQLGGLMQAAVTTAAPSYTTGKTNPLSLTTAGDLRTADTAGNALLTSMNATLTTLNFNTDTLETALGVLTETAPATDTASSGLNGRLQRVAQRLTSLIALIPSSLGAKTAAASFSVATATDDLLVTGVGGLTETAPATDTASSGLNGRLQRVAQRITSLIALVPASLGAKTAAASFAVTLASDDAAVTTLGATADAAVTAGATGSLSAKLRSISRDLVANIVLAAGSNLIGRAVADASAATGGIASTARLLSAAGTSGDAANVKASAGRLYSIQGYNAAAAVRYLKLYNSASAPTAGSGTPIKTLTLPPSVGFAFDWPLGYSFSTGLGFTLVTGVADNSSTSVTAADILGLNFDYT